MQHEQGHQCVCKEFAAMEVSTGELNILINKNREVEKVTLTIEGQKKDASNNPCQMNLQAELRFAW